LFEHLRKYQKFPEEVTVQYAAQILAALSHLHRHGIAYRDLKLENILLDGKGKVCLADFGLAKEGQGHRREMKTICGTPEYMVGNVNKVEG
jgi:serine/threonine protein kinase